MSQPVNNLFDRLLSIVRQRYPGFDLHAQKQWSYISGQLEQLQTPTIRLPQASVQAIQQFLQNNRMISSMHNVLTAIANLASVNAQQITGFENLSLQYSKNRAYLVSLRQKQMQQQNFSNQNVYSTLSIKSFKLPKFLASEQNLRINFSMIDINGYETFISKDITAYPISFAEMLTLTSITESCNIKIINEYQQEIASSTFDFLSIDFQQASENPNFSDFIPFISQDGQMQEESQINYNINFGNSVQNYIKELDSEMTKLQTNMDENRQSHNSILIQFPSLQLANNTQVQQTQNQNQNIPSALQSPYKSHFDQFQQHQQQQQHHFQSANRIDIDGNSQLSIQQDNATLQPYIQKDSGSGDIASQQIILMLVYLGVGILLGMKKSTMLDVAIALYFLISFFPRKESHQTQPNVLQRVHIGIGLAIVFDLVWLIFIGSKWLTSQRSDDQGVQPVVRILTFVFIIFFNIFKVVLLLLFSQLKKTPEEIQNLKASFAALLP